MWTTHRLTSRPEILAYLETDRLYAGYAIGDLEPGMWEQSTWAVAKRYGRIEALALHFTGLSLPAFLLMGSTEGIEAILADELWPTPIYLTCREKDLAMTKRFYNWQEITPMWRMVLGDNWPTSGVESVRLGPEHDELLTALYGDSNAAAFSVAQLESGVFYGIFDKEQIVAAAGTHLVSETYSIGAIGNVYTDPAYRRRGYGSATVAAVIDELVQRGMRDVILNVSQSNHAAIRVYERLGFERYCPFLEGPATAKD
jgi:ribosomal protein S18 acetylase RimI-like enzyme